MKSNLHASHLYLQIAGNIEQKIEKRVLKAGEKLPSVRTICREHGVSMSTALEAYYHLEGKGLIMSRPRSGYFVSRHGRNGLAGPSRSLPVIVENKDETNQLVGKVYANFRTDESVRFSLGVPAQEFLPVARLQKELSKAILRLPGHGTQYESVQGNEKLRRQLAMQTLHWKGDVAPDDFIITSGCMEAICLSLMSVTKPGDTIATESPVYFGLLQLAHGLGLNVVELPTDARTGIDVAALKSLAASGKIKACCLISNFNNPLGSCIPDESKKEITRFLARHGVIIIEDDLYGELFYGSQRPLTCKTFDTDGNVMWCGSISKTLAPGFRVGWVAPGRFKDHVMRQKLFNSISTTSIPQEAVATFFESGRYESHLRKLRGTLHANSLKMVDAITHHFPESTRISNPAGGFVTWIELDPAVNTSLLYDKLIAQGISIAPGRMFTLRNQYYNCMRLSYGLVWNEKTEQAIGTIGKAIRESGQ